MILFPNAKINLGLNIIAKRPDGYHDLETVFYPIQLNDALEIISNPTHQSSSFIFSKSGNELEGSVESNLCYKAWALLKKDFPSLPPLSLHLHKAIPMGAGLGGGSSDAAFTLMLLNKKYQLNIPKEQLIRYASLLGSDCPFFILNEPVVAEGRGEKMQPVNVDLKSYHIVIVFPGIHISTAWAFQQITPKTKNKDISQVVQQPVDTWKDQLHNDYERPGFI